MKLLIIGHGRHGKDSVCDILKEKYGFTFKSSSEFANERAVFPTLSKRYGYQSLQECFDDRHNHRQEWHDLIREYNEGDLSRLVRELLEEADIYCGLRNREEFEASKHLFDGVVWVDASNRLPPEPSNSIQLVPNDADALIDNNKDMLHLEFEVDSMLRYIQFINEPVEASAMV